MATKPFEILVSQGDVYVGPVGEAFSLLDDTPAGNWVLVGTAGKENIMPDGITFTHGQTVNLHQVYGARGPVKATRSEQSIVIGFSLYDFTLEEVTRALDDNTVSTTAAGSGTPGFKSVNLALGTAVSEKAYLIKFPESPEGDTWSSQYEIPRAVVTGSPALAFNKTDPVGLQFEITVLYDTAEAAGEETGRLKVQSATAL